MLKQRAYLIAIFALFGLFGLSACGTSSPIPTPIPIIPTLWPLTNTAIFWDAGIKINYPANWFAPIYTSTQMLLAPSREAAAQSPPSGLILSMRVATLAQLGLGKESTLSQVLQTVSALNQNTIVAASGVSTLAGLDATYMGVEDKKANLYQQTILARLPDGRVAWLIALAPSPLWADYAPDADKVRLSAVLLQPSAYPVKLDTGSLLSSRYPTGGLTFNLPGDWVAQPISDTYIYHPAADAAYQDGSGLSNGPQLMLRAVVLPANQSVAATLAQFLNAKVSAIQPIAMGKAALNGAQFLDSDPSTGQRITFIGLPTLDNKGLIVLRWTVPAALLEQTRPILTMIVQSVSLTAPAAPPTAPFKSP